MLFINSMFQEIYKKFLTHFQKVFFVTQSDMFDQTN